jgi:hypothetical protein
MKIVIIGWGSLIWNPLDLPKEGAWQDDGPILPIEFSRISKDARLTLVIDQINGADVKTKYVLSPRTVIEDTVLDLAKREETNIKLIGWVDSIKNSFSLTDFPRQINVHSRILSWSKEHNFGGVVWTALQPTFERDTGKPFSVDAALRYLHSLPNIVRTEALQYIRRAPDMVDTPLRRKVTTEFFEDKTHPSPQATQGHEIKSQSTEPSPLKSGLSVFLDGMHVSLVRYIPEKEQWLVSGKGRDFVVRASILEDAFYGRKADECITKNYSDYMSRFMPKKMTSDEGNTFEKT